MSDLYAQVQEQIACYGWSVLSSSYSGVPYAHTLGLTENFQHPELEVLGLSTELSTTFLNEIAGRVKAGQHFVTGSVLEDIVDGISLILTKNPFNPAGPPTSENRLRLIWPDLNSFYPWDPECSDEGKQQQITIDLDAWSPPYTF